MTSIVKYTAEIRAVDGSNRAVELQQGTSTRSTVLGSPKPQPLGLGGDPFGKGWDAFYDNVEVVPIISQNQKTATFYRFVFRHATPGNTSYTTAGDIANTFALIIDLLGELEDGTVVHVAQMHSQPIIVRGRSPSHYLKMKEKIIKTGCQRPRGGGGGRKKQRRARSSEEPEDEDGVSMDEAEFEADAVVKTEPLRNQVDVNSLAHALYHQVVRNAAETAAQELADAVERAASVPLPETQEQFEFAWPAQQVPSRFLDSALIPSPIATTEAIEPAGEPKEDQKSSSTGSAERLHSAASLFLQTSGSQFIDWNGGQPSSGEGEKTK